MTGHVTKKLKIMDYCSNIFNSRTETLVNTINCVGIMGKGLAKEFKKHFPEMFEDYKKRCENNEIKPGHPYFWPNVSGGKSIINFPSKNHWRDNSQLEWIETGLKDFSDKHHIWDVKSVAFPALGCNNGGLDWDVVKPMMIFYLEKLGDIDIEIYPPSTKLTPIKKNSLKDKRLKKGKRKEEPLPKFITADKLKKS